MTLFYQTWKCCIYPSVYKGQTVESKSNISWNVDLVQKSEISFFLQCLCCWNSFKVFFFLNPRGCIKWHAGFELAHILHCCRYFKNILPKIPVFTYRSAVGVINRLYLLRNKLAKPVAVMKSGGMMELCGGINKAEPWRLKGQWSN